MCISHDIFLCVSLKILDGEKKAVVRRDFRSVTGTISKQPLRLKCHTDFSVSIIYMQQEGNMGNKKKYPCYSP